MTLISSLSFALFLGRDKNPQLTSWSHCVGIIMSAARRLMNPFSTLFLPPPSSPPSLSLRLSSSPSPPPLSLSFSKLRRYEQKKRYNLLKWPSAAGLSFAEPVSSLRAVKGAGWLGWGGAGRRKGEERLGR